MSLPIVNEVNLTASALVARDPGKFYGFVVNSHTSGTVKFWDSLTASGTTILNTITLPAGSGLFYTLPMGVNFSTGLFITIGGTADVTVLYGGIDR